MQNKCTPTIDNKRQINFSIAFISTSGKNDRWHTNKYHQYIQVSKLNPQRKVAVNSKKTKNDNCDKKINGELSFKCKLWEKHSKVMILEINQL